jgi:cobalamin biosynthesis Mg chelatase CobN
MPALNTTSTIQLFLATNSAMASTSTESTSDSTGTIIFGIIASVLALMAIVIGYLQLRKTRP